MKRDDLLGLIRETLKRLPPPHDSHYGVVPPPPPEEAVSLGTDLHRHVDAQAAIAKVDALTSELRDRYFVSRILTRREAVSSSSIEGTNSTLDELLSVEEIDDEVDGGGKSAATLQVRDYALVLERLLPQALEEKDAIFTLDLIKDLHRQVMRSDPDYQGVPGEFRDKVVWIGGTGHIATSTWNPPPPEDVRGCLEQTLSYMRGEGMQVMTQSLIARMAIAHAHFEAVHPFADGNGRVGRLLWPLMMAAEGHTPLYLSPYVEAHKTAYYAALKQAQQRLEWSAVVGFVADAIVRTTAELFATREALSKLIERWRTRRRYRKNSASLRALDELLHYPIMTVNRLAALLDVTFPAASLAIDQLVEAKILKERTGYKRNRVFVAEEVLLILNRPFGADPVLPDGGDALA